MMTRPFRVLVLIIAVVVGIFLLKGQLDRDGVKRSERPDRNEAPSEVNGPKTPAEFDRYASRLVYTKHARCRMGCRHISENEVKQILEKGRINYAKSNPASRPDPKYALEGETDDGQEVRIIFAPTDRGMIVITVIDLEREWSCDCN